MYLLNSVTVTDHVIFSSITYFKFSIAPFAECILRSFHPFPRPFKFLLPFQIIFCFCFSNFWLGFRVPSRWGKRTFRHLSPLCQKSARLSILSSIVTNNIHSITKRVKTIFVDQKTNKMFRRYCPFIRILTSVIFKRTSQDTAYCLTSPLIAFRWQIKRIINLWFR